MKRRGGLLERYQKKLINGLPLSVFLIEKLIIWDIDMKTPVVNENDRIFNEDFKCFFLCIVEILIETNVISNI